MIMRKVASIGLSFPTIIVDGRTRRILKVLFHFNDVTVIVLERGKMFKIDLNVNSN